MCRPFRKRPRRPPPPAQRHHGLGDLHSSSSGMVSSSILSTDFSSTSTASAASIKEVLREGPTLFRFSELCIATDNFSPAKKVGRSVWKASLRGTTVAISRKHGCTRRLSSVLQRVHSLHHFNLIRLLGACSEGENLYLVYEFMESANLRDCLHSKHGVRHSALSSWHSRLQVAVDVAKGLEYLHHLSSPTFIHKYIDSRNILVSNDRRAKIAHVGIAALTGETTQEEMPESESGKIQQESSERRLTRSYSIKINGINGYMPPEYTISGEVSPKYDVFAFGVVLSEILSGREVVTSQPRQAGGKKPSLIEMLCSVMTEPDARGKLRIWMDPLLRDSYPLDDALEVAAIAKSCVDPNPSNRPEMLDVAPNLQKLLISSEKWEATMGAQHELMTSSLHPR